MINNIFVILSKKDKEYIESFKNCCIRQELDLDFSMENSDDEDQLIKKIDDSAAVLLLLSENSHQESLILQLIKYTHDINKSLIVLADHSGGLFNKWSWLDKEMNINTQIYDDSNQEELGEALAELRAYSGISVDMGDRVGGLVTFEIDCPCDIIANNRIIFSANTSGTYKYRIKEGNYTFTYKSKKLNGAEVYNKSIDVITNGFYTVSDSVIRAEKNYLTKVVTDNQALLDSCILDKNKLSCAMVASQNKIDFHNEKLKTPRPTYCEEKASTGSKVMYSLIFGIIGLFCAGFGAIVGLCIGPFIAQLKAKSDSDKKYNNELKKYNNAMKPHQEKIYTESIIYKELTQKLNVVENKISKAQHQLDIANELLKSY